MDNPVTNKRKGFAMRMGRFERDEEVLVDVINCAEQPELNNTSLACRTVDVSEHGMKMKSAIHIPVDTQLALRLDLDSVRYRLEGEVRWCKEEGESYIGLLIHNSSQDIIPWTRMFRSGL